MGLDFFLRTKSTYYDDPVLVDFSPYRRRRRKCWLCLILFDFSVTGSSRRSSDRFHQSRSEPVPRSVGTTRQIGIFRSRRPSCRFDDYGKSQPAMETSHHLRSDQLYSSHRTHWWQKRILGHHWYQFIDASLIAFLTHLKFAFRARIVGH